MVLVLDSSQVAPASTTIVAKPWYATPIAPLSVPVPLADASSRVLLALLLAVTRPTDTAPGSSTRRLLPVPPSDSAMPLPPLMVPALVSVPPAVRYTPIPALPVIPPSLTTVPGAPLTSRPSLPPAIEPVAVLVTEPPAFR